MEDKANESAAIAAEQAAPSEGEEKKGKKKTLLIILLALLLAASLGALGYMAWNHFNPPAGDAGATVSKYEGMTREEIQAELDRQTEESRMTISVNSQPTLKDGRARVNVINDEGNKFDQSFTLVQDDAEIYQSGVIHPGETVEWCDAEGLHAGEATITVARVDSATGSVVGNPQSVAVTVNEAAE